jgi:hypothetical protein
MDRLTKRSVFVSMLGATTILLAVTGLLFRFFYIPWVPRVSTVLIVVALLLDAVALKLSFRDDWREALRS